MTSYPINAVPLSKVSMAATLTKNTLPAAAAGGGGGGLKVAAFARTGASAATASAASIPASAASVASATSEVSPTEKYVGEGGKGGDSIVTVLA